MTNQSKPPNLPDDLSDEDITAFILKHGGKFYAFRRLYVGLGNSEDLRSAIEAFEEFEACKEQDEPI